MAKWTNAEIEKLVDGYKAGLTFPQIHELLPNHPVPSIEGKASQLRREGVFTDARRMTWNDERDAFLVEMVEAGESYEDIAAALATDLNSDYTPTVQNMKSRYRYLTEGSTYKKWSADDTALAHSMYENGATYDEIAARLGRSCASVAIHVCRNTTPLKARGKRWTAEEDATLRDCYYNKGLKFREMGDYLPNRSMSACRGRAQVLGLHSRYNVDPDKADHTRVKWTAGDDATLLYHISNGMPREKTVNLFETRTKNSVYNRINKVRHDHKDLTRANALTNWTVEDDDALRALVRCDANAEMRAYILKRPADSINEHIDRMSSADYVNTWRRKDERLLAQMVANNTPIERMCEALKIDENELMRHIAGIRPAAD